MELSRVRHFQSRVFQCGTCNRIEATPFTLDPKKTEAVGWLFTDQKPRGRIERDETDEGRKDSTVRNKTPTCAQN
jgi:hypothetical protein